MLYCSLFVFIPRSLSKCIFYKHISCNRTIDISVGNFCLYSYYGLYIILISFISFADVAGSATVSAITTTNVVVAVADAPAHINNYSFM